MEPDNDSCPIKLTGDGCLDYACVATYMNTKFNTETVSRDLAKTTGRT